MLLSPGTAHARTLAPANFVMLAAPADPGPPPTLPDLGPPPSLPPTDSPVIAPEPSPTPPSRPSTSPAKPTSPTSPTTPTTRSPTRPSTSPTSPTSPSPQRPTTLRPRSITPVSPIPTPPPAEIPAPALPPPAGIPEPQPPALSDSPATSSPAPDSPTRPAAPVDPALEAPKIGADPADEAPRKGPTLADLEQLERERTLQERKSPKKWRHGGLIVDLQLGTAFCTRQFCRSSTGHDAAPGVALGGFFGGNVLGILEVGLAVGWNTLRPRGVADRNAISLYGLDPVLLQQVIAEQIGLPGVELDFSTLNTTSASSRAFNVGPSLRIHFIRKGRGLAYAGAGLHYQLWRNRYATTGGDTRLDFHGISAPFHIGGGAYVHPNIAVVGEFTYALTYFVLGGVKHPSLSSVAPLAVIEESAVEAGSSLIKGLPHLGKFTVNLRFRF